MFMMNDQMALEAMPSAVPAMAKMALDPDRIEQACQQACDQIAPAWPLDQSIAVNPHWKRVQLPLREVAARMAVLADMQIYPARDYVLQAWKRGRIRAEDLQLALQQYDVHEHIDDCVRALSKPIRSMHLPLLIDVLDDDAERFRRLSWRDAITHQVSQTCAAYFDRDQSGWQPERGDSLYAFWRDTLVHDHGIGTLMGLPQIHDILEYLPPTRQQAERWVVQVLGLEASMLADYFEAVLLTVNGWASWCAYLDWQAKLNGQSDHSLRDLLAIRLAWGVIVMQCKGFNASHNAIAQVRQKWQSVDHQIQAAAESLRLDEVWQYALEIGYQRSLAQQLAKPVTASASDVAQAPVLQAAFCIDVRSEPMRSALEAVNPGIRTLGVAGFFGLPAAYQPLASRQQRPQLPGLLAPKQIMADRVLTPVSSAHAASGRVHLRDISAAVGQQRQRHFMLADQVARLTQYPGAAFSLVETAGPLFLKSLWSMVRPSQRARQAVEHQGLPKKYKNITRPSMQRLPLDEQAQLCAGILRAMGLQAPFAPIVMLVGHASQTANNAHASSLDCGACCGQSGEANTRALAMMLNDPQVRLALGEHGIQLPDQTRFVAALHNTTTQEIQGFDLDLLDASSLACWQALQPWLQQASHQVRAQLQASHMPVSDAVPARDASGLLKYFMMRANDAAQVRPEWGLANNAAFILAPRARTQHLDLAGRVFLHEYDSSQDSDGALLEQLMTAPMLVTHWINWQYHASTCAPERLGSGNKLLHNVVGGRIGVFEGNGGDLRIGLSRQSLHNGQQWMHEPLRLTVVIAATRARIQAIIEKHAIVKQLVSNGWLHLWCEEQGSLWQYPPAAIGNALSATPVDWQPLSI